jgi:tRNA dimethylallyltransferase
MLVQGFIEEVQKLFTRGDLQPTLPALRAVGYRQVWQYLAGELEESHLSEQAIIATRQLAKRQLTWLRSEMNAHWFDSQQPTIAQQILKYLADHPFLSRKGKVIFKWLWR